jgi:hypothetical protein
MFKLESIFINKNIRKTIAINWIIPDDLMLYDVDFTNIFSTILEMTILLCSSYTRQAWTLLKFILC